MTTSITRTFRPDIQGIRAIAVLLVLVYHAGVVFVPGGYIGVDVFFVVSGFLITGHLLSQLERKARINFVDFYARRVRRILPASMAVLALTVLAAMVVVPPLQREAVLRDALATALYVPNYFFAMQGTNYLAAETPSMFQHYWSLGVEEQFYLFWPAILGLGYLLLRRSRRSLFVLMALLVVASFGFSVWLLGQSQPWAFFSLPSRAWEFGAGGLLAFALTKGARWVQGVPVAILGWVGLGGLLALAAVYNGSTVFPGVNALLPVAATTALIVGCTAEHAWSPTRMLSLAPMQWFGMISYSLYLVHWPILMLAQAAIGLNVPMFPWFRLALALVSIPVAHFLYVVIENPARTAEFWNNARPRRTLVIGLTASVAVLTLSAGSLVLTTNTALSTNQAAASTGTELGPQGTAYVPSNLKPSLQDSVTDNPVVYANGCHRDFNSTDASGCQVGSNPSAPVVALFGDSHAAQWYPALIGLADAGEIRLDMNTKSSCPSVSVELLRDGSTYTQCEQWRTGVIKRLATEQPALVLLANYGRAELKNASDNEFASRWGTGLQKTIDALAPSTVAVLSDTPDMGSPPAICLSSHLDDAAACARPANEAINGRVRKVEQAVSGATYLDFIGYFCDQKTCPAVIGSTLVYRDSHHMTATFSSGLSKVVGRQVKKLLGITG
ncbi:acyltransferase family protein [Glaciihabitans sp. UYNi722]|uniref:acyltransferase family protein n=1 Tax=Glaciihabitans sp. UYNi722 TaxID=3156344 RepID=UPI0033962E30